MLKIYLLSSAFNGFTQKVFTILGPEFDVKVGLALNDDMIISDINEFNPAVVICPYLKDRIPEVIWEKFLCLIIHPGIVGDRGPSSLDWAILEEQSNWGVTALEASEEMDAGNIWASESFPMQNRRKSFIYNRLVTEAGLKTIRTFLERYIKGNEKAIPPEAFSGERKGTLKPLMTQNDRRIFWDRDSGSDIIRKINASDGFPGVLCTLLDEDVFLYDAHLETQLKHDTPGQIIGRCNEGICISTTDGAIWITHLKRKKTDDKKHFKVPASLLLADHLISVPNFDFCPFQETPSIPDWQDIRYEESGSTGMLSFDFYNGAMNTSQCIRLASALTLALKRKTETLILRGGDIFWSNGINLNTIEYADNPAEEAWKNICEMDSLIELILKATDKLTIAVIEGNAGAGGVFLALACDRVYMSESGILNPHYKTMGLFGSEFWTLTLPRRVGSHMADYLTNACPPVNARQALKINLIDGLIYHDETIDSEISGFLKDLSKDRSEILDKKKIALDQTSLAKVKDYELAQMRMNFFSDNLNFTEKRKRFVFKEKPQKFCQPAKVWEHFSDQDQARSRSFQ